MLAVLGVVAGFEVRATLRQPCIPSDSLFGGCLLISVLFEVLIVAFGEAEKFPNMAVLDDMLGIGKIWRKPNNDQEDKP
jgi:hypothetical protein